MQLSEETAKRNRAITFAGLKGIGGNAVLVTLKIIIGLSANSIAIILDAVNNLTDILSSVLTIIGTKLAGKRADKEHPFGHGRIEYITTMVIAFIIIFAIAVKITMGLYFRRQGTQWRSSALSAAGIDSLYDAILTFVTLISSLLVYCFSIDIQGYVGAAIGLMIIRAGAGIVHDMYNHLLGVRTDPTLVRRIKERIASYPQVGGVYDLVLNSYGPEETIGSVHISVPDTLTAAEIHPLGKHIDIDIYNEFGIVLTTGIYAENTNDSKALEIKSELDKILSLYPHVVQVHAFYVQEEEKTIYYDIIFDFDEPDPVGTLRSIKADLAERVPDYQQCAILDTNFSN